MSNLPKKIQKFKDLEKDFGTTVAQALWQKTTKTINYIEKSYPLGMLMFVHETQDNIPETPDTKYWHFMDGSTINNPNSIFDGQTPPDLRDLFFKHPGSGQTELVIAGSNTVDLSHNHSGFTAFVDPRGAFELDNGGDNPAEVNNHRHSISNQFSSTEPFMPRFIKFKVYMRIA